MLDRLLKKQDPFEVLREASKSKRPGYQNSRMMHDDFLALFFQTERGKRVFHQIMEWSGMFRTSFVPKDPYATHFREGERNLGARILSSCLKEPNEKPQKQNTRDDNG